MVPLPRTVQFGDKGLDVLVYKRALRRAQYYPKGVILTTRFRQRFRRSVTSFQEAHNLHPDGAIGPKTYAKIYPFIDRYGVWLIRYYLRQHPIVAAGRQRFVGELWWGVTHEPQIHYAKIRPIPYIAWRRHALPITTDCSGSVTAAAFAAGLPDPNGLAYDGQGYTGDLLAHLPHISYSQAQLGDLLVFGAGEGDHVVALLELGPDPLVFSHGTERGPVALRLSYVKTGFVGKPETWLRLV